MGHNTEYDTPSSRYLESGRVLALFRPWRRRLLLLGGLLAFGAMVGVASPFLLREIIDSALPERNLSLLTWLALALVGVTAIGASINVLQTILSTKIGQEVMHDLRVRLYSHLQTLSLGFYTRTRTGEIQARIANDVGGLQSVVSNTMTEMARNVSIIVTTAVAMVLLDWRLALFSFAVLPPLVLLSSKIGERRERLTHEQQEGHAEMSAAVQETLSAPGIVLSRTMARSAFLNHRFARASAEVAKLEVRAHTAGEWQWTIIYLLLGALPALTLLLGGWLIGQGTVVTIGTLVALIALQEQLMWPLEALLASSVQLRSTRALFIRIFEYLDTKPEVTEPEHPKPFPATRAQGHVRLEGVSYGYQRLSASTVSRP